MQIRDQLKSCAHKNRIQLTGSTRLNLQLAKDKLDKIYTKHLDNSSNLRLKATCNSKVTQK